MKEEEKRVRIMIGEDFNARTREKGGWVEEDGEEMEGQGRRIKGQENKQKGEKAIRV